MFLTIGNEAININAMESIKVLKVKGCNPESPEGVCHVIRFVGPRGVYDVHPFAQHNDEKEEAAIRAITRAWFDTLITTLITSDETIIHFEQMDAKVSAMIDSGQIEMFIEGGAGEPV